MKSFSFSRIAKMEWQARSAPSSIPILPLRQLRVAPLLPFFGDAAHTFSATYATRLPGVLVRALAKCTTCSGRRRTELSVTPERSGSAVGAVYECVFVRACDNKVIHTTVRVNEKRGDETSVRASLSLFRQFSLRCHCDCEPKI